MGYNADSYVGNVIPEVDENVIKLIYQNSLTEEKINEFLNLKTDASIDGSAWNLKNELNFPGPFYTGETDTCGTGIIEAPKNVIFDRECMEHVMIQPRTKKELLGLRDAGAIEVFGEYYCDGNKHWTIQLVKEWWSNRNDIFKSLQDRVLIKMNCNQEKRYKYYLDNVAELDLKRYCFFLDNGFYSTDEKLPNIE